ncbi:hypothetical protein ACFWAZ_12255 [Streptomyces collinus]|uniref:hypothetical protein n=1 Tax=Streptomyces collinus TaxID=42684 RepID=UPI0036538058
MAKRRRQHDTFLSQAWEGRQLLTAARDNRLWAAYKLAVRIGLRRGELLGLRWSYVDLH